MLRLIPPTLMLVLLSVLTFSGCVLSVSDPCMSPRAPSTRAWAAGDKGCACTTPCGTEGRTCNILMLTLQFGIRRSPNQKE